MSLTRIARLAIAATLTGASLTAQALVVVVGNSGTLTLHVDQMQYAVVFGAGAPAAIESGETWAHAVADGAIDFVDAADPLALLSASAASGSASATSTAGDVLEVSISATYPGTASGEVSRLATVAFAGTGTLVVQVPYTLDLTFDALGDPTAYAAAHGWIGAAPSGGAALAYESSVSAYFDAGTGPASIFETGFLSIAVPFTAGDLFDFSAYAALTLSTTAIPLPPALWLLGGALAFLGAQRRRAA